MKTFLAAFLLGVIIAPLAKAAADSPADVVSRGNRVELKNVLKPESPTILLFVQDTSGMEQQFRTDVEKVVAENKKVGLKLALIKDTNAPVAREFEVTETPTAIVYDRFGKTLAKTSNPDEIKAAARKGELMARIKWIDEDDPKAPEVYGAPAMMLKRGLPGIVKTMGMRPEAFKMFNQLGEIHFRDGFLKRREHEMVGAYVSALNKCRF